MNPSGPRGRRRDPERGDGQEHREPDLFVPVDVDEVEIEVQQLIERTTATVELPDGDRSYAAISVGDATVTSVPEGVIAFGMPGNPDRETVEERFEGDETVTRDDVVEAYDDLQTERSPEPRLFVPADVHDLSFTVRKRGAEYEYAGERPDDPDERDGDATWTEIGWASDAEVVSVSPGMIAYDWPAHPDRDAVVAAADEVDGALTVRAVNERFDVPPTIRQDRADEPTAGEDRGRGVE